MSICYLNGEYLPLDQARISPLDRGFLFGDGIYEVVPSYGGKLVGFGPHIDRMKEGMALIEIDFDWDHAQWKDLCETLMAKNGNGNLGIYLHVSRGADTKRYGRVFHGLLDAGVYIAPSQFEAGFTSISHDAAVMAEAQRALASGQLHELDAQRGHGRLARERGPGPGLEGGVGGNESGRHGHLRAASTRRGAT